MGGCAVKRNLVACLLFACLSAAAQETTSGLSIPVTLSGELRYTPGDSGDGQLKPGFRAVVAPYLRLGPHWFLYSALDVHSSSYFPYQIGAYGDQPVDVALMQAFLGYTGKVSGASFLIKAGQLSSAFGLFPLDYDDAKMALINPPLEYTLNLPLRADQLPCDIQDVYSQPYGSEIQYHCGGSNSEQYGVTPVTLFGLPSIEAQLSIGRTDARVQITNSSPANPHGLASESQLVQWTAGAGYTFAEGLHVGVSGFRGPYLDRSVEPFLPAGTTLRSFPAFGAGLDARWSRGAWSLQGEWQHFHFALPAFPKGVSETAAYGEVKRIVSPRLYVAARITGQDFGPIQDAFGGGGNHSDGPREVYEATVGYRLNRQQLLKVGGAWTNRHTWAGAGWFWPQNESSMFEVQLVTTLPTISKAFH